MPDVTTSFTPAELASKAGVEQGYVERLVGLGVLKPDDEGLFRVGAIRITRLVQTLERGGLPLDGIATAIASGRVSFDFLGLPVYDRIAGLSDTTFGSLHERTGIPLELLQAMREAIGLARPEPEDLMRDDELALAGTVRSMTEGGIEPASVGRFLRVYSENLRRIVDSESDWYRAYLMQPMIDGGMSEAAALTMAGRAAGDFADAMQSVFVGLYHAQQEQSWIRTIFEVVESALEQAGLWTRLPRPPAVSFLDLTGYTRLTEERGDAAAADMAASLARSVQRIAREHCGLPVKWLGDGVMFHFDEPAGAVEAALDMVEQVPAAGLPPARVGIDAGPVFFQDGDYFGRTVNVAARIAAYAGAGQVLVSDAVLQAGETPGCRFEPIGPVELKGVANPVPLHAVHRAGSETQIVR